MVKDKIKLVVIFTTSLFYAQTNFSQANFKEHEIILAHKMSLKNVIFMILCSK